MKLLRREILSHKAIYIVLFLLLLLATYFRVYRTDQLLGFYFDQGRDALVISQLIEKGKWFLIGPTTGIAGIFRGPFYYYLITPAYYLGNGNPLYPALFLEIISVIALALLYYLTKEASGRGGGILAVIIAGSSYFIITASRWLSNPTPMLLLSLLLVWMMHLIHKGKRWAWIPLSFIAGSSLFHFGSSGEFFYFPALLIFTLWQVGVFRGHLKFPPLKVIILSIFAFALTAAPLVLFDFRHDQILSHNIIKFFVGDGSFKASFWQVATQRVHFFTDVFYNKVLLEKKNDDILIFLIVLTLGLVKLPKLLKNDVFKISFLLFVSPLVGLMFFQGNEGNIYDYYLTGYYLIFILLLSTILYEIWSILPGRLIVVIFVYYSLSQNIPLAWKTIHYDIHTPETISFGAQKEALDWVFNDSRNQKFNIDTYVPPVIPFSYAYLQHWYSNNLNKPGLSDEKQSLLYTLYEVDPPHPERLNAWMERQDGIGRVLYEKHFGGITVQRRLRI